MNLSDSTNCALLKQTYMHNIIPQSISLISALLSVQTCCFRPGLTWDWFGIWTWWWTWLNGYGDLITTKSYSAGSMVRYHPGWDRGKHQQEDVEPKEWCCLLSDSCDLDYRRRPLVDCMDYVGPIISKSLTANMCVSRNISSMALK